MAARTQPQAICAGWDFMHHGALVWSGTQVSTSQGVGQGGVYVALWPTFCLLMLTPPSACCSHGIDFRSCLVTYARRARSVSSFVLFFLDFATNIAADTVP